MSFTALRATWCRGQSSTPSTRGSARSRSCTTCRRTSPRWATTSSIMDCHTSCSWRRLPISPSSTPTSTSPSTTSACPAVCGEERRRLRHPVHRDHHGEGHGHAENRQYIVVVYHTAGGSRRSRENLQRLQE